MPFDTHKNFSYSTVATAPTPASSGTALTVQAGHGPRFPTAPFNATVWPAAVLPLATNAEVVRVTAVTGDVLTMTRAQEGSAARAIGIGDQIAATITAKTLTDLESGTNFPLITTPGTVSAAEVVTPIVRNNAAGPVDLITTSEVRQRVYPSGGVSIGNAPSDPGVNNVRVQGAVTAGGLILGGPATNGVVRTTTVDGADNVGLQLTGGGGVGESRAASLQLWGNEAGLSGGIQISAGDAPNGNMYFYTTPGTLTLRGIIHRSGGFTWGGATDAAGAGGIFVGAGSFGVGAAFVRIVPGGVQIGQPSATGDQMVFYTSSGIAGTINSNGTTTTYGTTSDARLKTDRGPLTDRTVLEQTRVHAFDWTADGTPGRGVFAQEAATVAPFAVTEGTDERDDQGHLTRPWGVDYAKYVPDLIAGWQHHQARIAELEARLAALEARLTELTT